MEIITTGNITYLSRGLNQMEDSKGLDRDLRQAAGNGSHFSAAYAAMFGGDPAYQSAAAAAAGIVFLELVRRRGGLPGVFQLLKFLLLMVSSICLSFCLMVFSTCLSFCLTMVSSVCLS